MARTEKLRVICYDVCCDKRRGRIARCLEDQATRVQYSVFEARLTSRKLFLLIDTLTHNLGPGDSVRVYTIGKSGEDECTVYGAGVPVDRNAAYWLL